MLLWTSAVCLLLVVGAGCRGLYYIVLPSARPAYLSTKSLSVGAWLLGFFFYVPQKKKNDRELRGEVQTVRIVCRKKSGPLSFSFSWRFFPATARDAKATSTLYMTKIYFFFGKEKEAKNIFLSPSFVFSLRNRSQIERREKNPKNIK